MQQRISPARMLAPMFDQSIAYLVGTFSVLSIGLVALTVRATDFDLGHAFNDEVKVEAAQFPFKPNSDMDIFAAGCNSKTAAALCKTH